MSTQCAELDVDAGWDQSRWANILDRIEHRRFDVGLRFWGPPLWLEVTMIGPDSDLWPTVSEQPTAWDWQSNTPCGEAVRLTDEGADDDRLLSVVARYTIENLILNAVHEIGEWLRFDGERLFPAHRSGAAALSGCDDQGNGSVTVHFESAQATHRSATVPAGPAPDDRELLSRLTDAAAPARFTYLPGATISYEATGPLIRRWSAGKPTTAWRSTWSSSTLEALEADRREVVALVGRDVHRALVAHEADRICRAFHVDGSRPWCLAVADPALGADPPDIGVGDAELLSILVDYAAPTGAR